MSRRAAATLVGVLSGSSVVILAVLITSAPFPVMLTSWPDLAVPDVTILFTGTLAGVGALVLLTRWETPSRAVGLQRSGRGSLH